MLFLLHKGQYIQLDDIATGNTEPPVPVNVSVTGLGTDTTEDAAAQARIKEHLCNSNSLFQSLQKL